MAPLVAPEKVTFPVTVPPVKGSPAVICVVLSLKVIDGELPLIIVVIVNP
jgi:hypothetical protein